MDILAIINEQTEHTISLATSIKRPSLKETEAHQFRPKEISDLDSLSYNSFEKTFNEFDGANIEIQQRLSKKKEGVQTQRNDMKNKESLLNGQRTFGDNLNVLLGIKVSKPPSKIAVNDLKTDSIFSKDRSRGKAEVPINLSRNSNALQKGRVEKKVCSLLNAKPIPSVIKLANSNFQQDVPFFNKNKDPKSVSIINDVKGVFQSKIYRFANKNNEKLMPRLQPQKYTSKKNTLLTQTTRIEKISELQGPTKNSNLVNRIEGYLEMHPQVSGNTSASNTFLQGKNPCSLSPVKTLTDKIGLIYSHANTAVKLIRKERPAEASNFKTPKTTNLSFKEPRKTGLGLSFSVGKQNCLESLNKVCSPTPKKQTTAQIYSREQEADNQGFTAGVPKNQVGLRRFAKRLDSQPSISSKVSPDKDLKQRIFNLSSVKRHHSRSSQIANIIRKTQSLNMISEASTANRLEDMSNNDTTQRIPFDARDKALAVLHRKISALDKKLQSSLKKVNELSSKHKKLSGVLIKVVSDNINLKMQFKKHAPIPLDDGNPELLKAIKKVVSELVLSPDRIYQSENPKKDEQVYLAARLS